MPRPQRLVERTCRTLLTVALAALTSVCGGHGEPVAPRVPTLQSVTPNTATQGATVAVALIGTNFIEGATTVAVSGLGVTVSTVTVASGTALTANFVIGVGATLGSDNVTVTTAGGTSGAQPFTVTPPAPTLLSVTPNTGTQGATVAVALVGTNFIAGATTVAVSGTGITVSTMTVTSATSLTANFVIAVGATLGNDNVTVTTAGGTSGAQPFTVTAAPLATITFVTAPSDSAQTSVPLAQQPVLQLRDVNGNLFTTPTTVTASITQGSGIIASGGTARSGTNGNATFTGLTLGALNGTAGSETLIFSSQAVVSPPRQVSLSCFLQPLPLGTSANNTLGSGDCTFGSGTLGARYEKLYSSALTSAGAAVLTESGSFQPEVCVRGPNDSAFWCLPAASGETSVALTALLPAGPFLAGASALAVGEGGTYTLNVAQGSADLGSCETEYVLYSLTTAQQLTTSDCQFTNGGNYYDALNVPLAPGASFSVTMNATWSPKLAIYLDSAYVAVNSGATSATASYSNTTSASQFPYIVATGLNTGQLGAYTLTITIVYPASSAAAASDSPVRMSRRPVLDSERPSATSAPTARRPTAAPPVVPPRAP